VKPKISAIIGEMLLFVIGEQPRNSHKAAAHFSKLKNTKNQCIQARVAAMVNLGFSEQDLNALIDNRNSNSHCANLQQLVRRVNEAKEAFKVYPDLKTEMQKEFYLCAHFSFIRSYILCLPF
jgi:hypothetical protein